MNRQCFWWFLAAGVTISLGMTCIYYALDLGKVSGGNSDQQHRAILLFDSGGDISARCRKRDAQNRCQRGDDCRWRGAVDGMEITRLRWQLDGLL